VGPLLRALLLSLALLLAGAPAAAAQNDVGAIADGLRADSVYVARGVDADADAVREEIADRGLDVKIAVLPDEGSPADTAAQVYERLGGDGTLAVVAGDRIVAGPSGEAADAAREAAAANQGESVDAVLLDFVERVDEGSGGGGIGAGGLILLGLGGAGAAALVVSRRRRLREEAERFAEVKADARDDLVVLGDEIRALDLDMQMPGVSDEARADYETAVNAYDRANRTFELAGRPDDLEPVGAALEEGRWAMTSARARLDGR
jgi:hypothetical protein